MEVAAFHPVGLAAQRTRLCGPIRRLAVTFATGIRARPLAGIPLCGARTFLHADKVALVLCSDRLASSRGGFYALKRWAACCVEVLSAKASASNAYDSRRDA